MVSGNNSVYVPVMDGWEPGSCDHYEEDFLYDLNNDPFEINNLVMDESYAEIRRELAVSSVNHINLNVSRS